MLEVKLICIGKLKEKYWRDAVQEYAKRLSAFCRFQIIELNEARLPQDPNAAEIARALGEESKAISAAAGRSALYTLCIEGKLVSSTQLAQQIAEGRDRLDKELARLGKTAVKLDDLAKRLGFGTVDELCVAFAKEEITLTALAQAVQPPKPAPAPAPEHDLVLRGASSAASKGKVLVVGMDSLLTQLARCCHPVPPDEIVGYVTRGRGVMIHRADCPNLKNMVDQDHDRLIEVSWGRAGDDALYPADVLVIASDRSGIMKDVTEVMQREKVHVTALNTQILKGDQHMRFSLEVKGGNAMQVLLKGLRAVHGVLSARRL